MLKLCLCSGPVAPIKALCSQRFEDWKHKFGPLGLTCKELTGDTEIDDFFEIQDAHIIMTTPVSDIVYSRSQLVTCAFSPWEISKSARKTKEQIYRNTNIALQSGEVTSYNVIEHYATTYTCTQCCNSAREILNSPTEYMVPMVSRLFRITLNHVRFIHGK